MAGDISSLIIALVLYALGPFCSGIVGGTLTRVILAFRRWSNACSSRVPPTIV